MSQRNIVHIEIPTNNARQSGDFYQKLFGWEIEHNEAMNYTMWDPQTGPGGGFSTIGEDTKVGEVLIYVDSSDITADLQHAAALGGAILVEKTEIPGMGWFGMFKDPIGNTIGLYTSMNS